MKRGSSLLLFLLPWLLAFAQAEDVLPLRMITYNIRHGAGMDNVVNLDRQAAVIARYEPDLVALQEVDSIVPRSGKTHEAAYLANAVGMKGTFGPAIPLSGGKYGVAILSREAPLSVRNIPLPGKEPRTLLVCEFEHYVFACTHLDLVEENRLASLPIIIEEASRWEKPFFVCGDWNDSPSSTLIRKMKASFSFLNYLNDAKPFYTFPADTPTSTIDYIATYGKLAGTVKYRQVINEPQASDHRPVLVDIELNLHAAGMEMMPENEASAELYDLAGRRVSSTNTPAEDLPPGLYLQKNRKILKK